MAIFLAYKCFAQWTKTWIAQPNVILLADLSDGIFTTKTQIFQDKAIF